MLAHGGQQEEVGLKEHGGAEHKHLRPDLHPDLFIQEHGLLPVGERGDLDEAVLGDPVGEHLAPRCIEETCRIAQEIIERGHQHRAGVDGHEGVAEPSEETNLLGMQVDEEAGAAAVAPASVRRLLLTIIGASLDTSGALEGIDDDRLLQLSLIGVLGPLEVTATTDAPIGAGGDDAPRVCLNYPCRPGHEVGGVLPLDGHLDDFAGEDLRDQGLLALRGEGKTTALGDEPLNAERHRRTP